MSGSEYFKGLVINRMNYDTLLYLRNPRPINGGARVGMRLPGEAWGLGCVVVVIKDFMGGVVMVPLPAAVMCF